MAKDATVKQNKKALAATVNTKWWWGSNNSTTKNESIKLKKILITVTLVMSLSSCSFIQVVPANDHSHAMMSDSSEYSSLDLMFAQMMIPHHQQAVDMGKLAETRASNLEVKALAAQIKAEQEPEITLMKTWLKDSGSMMGGMHDMPMQGMLTESALAELAGTTGKAFDILYLKDMIAHHEGAISMARGVENSKNESVAKLAKSIISSQQKQIVLMQKLLTELQ